MEYLPDDIRRDLLMARQRPRTGQNRRLCVHVGAAVFPLLGLWETGFSVSSTRTPKLRGLVDLFDGPRHLSQCLIVAAESDGEVMVYEFKRSTAPRDRAARDYAEDEARITGRLPGPA